MIPASLRLTRWFPCLLVFFAAVDVSAAKADDPGELEIRNVLPLDEAARARLARIVAESEDARRLLDEKKAALPAIADKTPRPLAVLVYEGRLNTDPQRHKTVRHLYDFDHIGAWFEVWQATGDADLARRLREFISAWAAVYKPTGNDVNEYKLMPLFTAYVALRQDFEAEERERIDAWLRDIAERHLAAARRLERATNNRFAKSLRIVATAALALDEDSWRDACIAAVHALVKRGLYPDGSSHDFRTRDTLTYHTTTLRPMMDIALLTRDRGESLYEWVAPNGASIKKSVDFVVPYARREKVHAEWVNTQVDIDRRRAAAGIPHYQPGRPYDPVQAVPLLEEAEFFDPSLGPIVADLVGRPGSRFPTWRLVLNAALRE